MSAHHCEHDNLISDGSGEYRCYQCEPVDMSDVEELVDTKVDAKLREVFEVLERVVIDRRLGYEFLQVVRLAAGELGYDVK